MIKPMFVYHPDYYADIGEHVFPMMKFRLLHDRIIQESLAVESDFLVPGEAEREDLELVHTAEYLDDLFSLRRTYRTARSELPLTKEIVRAFALAAGGTILAGRKALEYKCVAMNLTGGFHHAFADHAEGFCYINDVAVAIRALQREGIGNIAVIDCDLHQGNGTANIFRGDHSVFTYSIHQENNYPHKEKGDLDRGLADGVEDDVYLGHLESDLNTIDKKIAPEAVFYVAGSDPYHDDRLGGVRLTIEGFRRRDEMVLSHFISRDVPVAVVLAGGYARSIEDTVTIHYGTAEVLTHICTRFHDKNTRLGAT